MKKINYIITLTLLVAFMSFTVQDFYSSMTKVDYMEGNKTLKFTTKMNTMHVANAIKINPNTAAFEAELKKYVNRSMEVSVNGNAKTLVFTGSQVNGESVWVYFETDGISDINDLKIKNTILLDVYAKQFNVVNIAYKGQQKTMNFTKGKEINTVNF